MSRSVCLISLATSSLVSWHISQIKGDIHRYVMGTSIILWDIGKLRYRQWGAKLDNLIPSIVLLISQLPNIAQKTTCTQNVPMDVTFQLRYVKLSNTAFSLRN